MTSELNISMIYPDIDALNEQNEPCTHYVHRGFGQSVCADFLSLSIIKSGPIAGSLFSYAYPAVRFRPPRYDVYILEFADLLYVAPIIKRMYPNARVFVLATGHPIWDLNVYKFSNYGILKSKVKKIDRIIDRKSKYTIVKHYVDGIFAVSNIMADYLNSVLGEEMRLAVTKPFIEQRLYESLQTISPNLASNTAVMIGEERDHKGFDILVDAWDDVRRSHPDAELLLVGPGHPSSYEEVPGVRVLGYVEDIKSVFSRASLYIHSARAEGYGVTVLEAMRAGLPSIVTSKTGAKDEVKPVDESMVVRSDPEVLSQRVNWYFNLDLNTRCKLSERSERQTDPFDPETRMADFENQFIRMMGEITDNSCVKP